jgi:hypothetical protein
MIFRERCAGCHEYTDKDRTASGLIHLRGLGPREYDPVKLGLIVDVACLGEDCLVDTSLVGSGNGGHSFGTDMSETDRMLSSNISRPIRRSRQGLVIVVGGKAMT